MSSFFGRRRGPSSASASSQFSAAASPPPAPSKLPTTKNYRRVLAAAAAIGQRALQSSPNPASTPRGFPHPHHARANGSTGALPSSPESFASPDVSADISRSAGPSLDNEGESRRAEPTPQVQLDFAVGGHSLDLEDWLALPPGAGLPASASASSPDVRAHSMDTPRTGASVETPGTGSVFGSTPESAGSGRGFGSSAGGSGSAFSAGSGSGSGSGFSAGTGRSAFGVRPETASSSTHEGEETVTPALRDMIRVARTRHEVHVAMPSGDSLDVSENSSAQPSRKPTPAPIVIPARPSTDKLAVPASTIEGPPSPTPEFPNPHTPAELLNPHSAVHIDAPSAATAAGETPHHAPQTGGRHQVHTPARSSTGTSENIPSAISGASIARALLANSFILASSPHPESAYPSAAYPQSAAFPNSAYTRGSQYVGTATSPRTGRGDGDADSDRPLIDSPYIWRESWRRSVASGPTSAGVRTSGSTGGAKGRWSVAPPVPPVPPLPGALRQVEGEREEGQGDNHKDGGAGDSESEEEVAVGTGESADILKAALSRARSETPPPLPGPVPQHSKCPFEKPASCSAKNMTGSALEAPETEHGTAIRKQAEEDRDQIAERSAFSSSTSTDANANVESKAAPEVPAPVFDEPETTPPAAAIDTPAIELVAADDPGLIAPANTPAADTATFPPARHSIESARPPMARTSERQLVDAHAARPSMEAVSLRPSVDSIHTTSTAHSSSSTTTANAADPVLAHAPLTVSHSRASTSPTSPTSKSSRRRSKNKFALDLNAPGAAFAPPASLPLPETPMTLSSASGSAGSVSAGTPPSGGSAEMRFPGLQAGGHGRGRSPAPHPYAPYASQSYASHSSHSSYASQSHPFGPGYASPPNAPRALPIGRTSSESSPGMLGYVTPVRNTLLPIGADRPRSVAGASLAPSVASGRVVSPRGSETDLRTRMYIAAAPNPGRRGSELASGGRESSLSGDLGGPEGDMADRVWPVHSTILAPERTIYAPPQNSGSSGRSVFQEEVEFSSLPFRMSVGGGGTSAVREAFPETPYSYTPLASASPFAQNPMQPRANAVNGAGVGRGVPRVMPVIRDGVVGMTLNNVRKWALTSGRPRPPLQPSAIQREDEELREQREDEELREQQRNGRQAGEPTREMLDEIDWAIEQAQARLSRIEESGGQSYTPSPSPSAMSSRAQTINPPLQNSELPDKTTSSAGTQPPPDEASRVELSSDERPTQNVETARTALSPSPSLILPTMEDTPTSIYSPSPNVSRPPMSAVSPAPSEGTSSVGASSVSRRPTDPSTPSLHLSPLANSPARSLTEIPSPAYTPSSVRHPFAASPVASLQPALPNTPSPVSAHSRSPVVPPPVPSPPAISEPSPLYSPHPDSILNPLRSPPPSYEPSASETIQTLVAPYPPHPYAAAATPFSAIPPPPPLPVPQPPVVERTPPPEQSTSTRPASIHNPRKRPLSPVPSPAAPPAQQPSPPPPPTWSPSPSSSANTAPVQEVTANSNFAPLSGSPATIEPPPPYAYVDDMRGLRSNSAHPPPPPPPSLPLPPPPPLVASSSEPGPSTRASGNTRPLAIETQTEQRSSALAESSRARPPLPAGPRKASLSQPAPILNTSPSPSSPTTTSSASPGSSPSDDSISFDFPPAPFRSLTAEQAQWTLTSAQLQDIVSAAIRQDSLSIRLLPPDSLEQLPAEIERLDRESQRAREAYRTAARRRRDLEGFFASMLSSSASSSAGGAAAARILADLQALSEELDGLAATIYTSTARADALRQQHEVHRTSALQFALRKLNGKVLAQLHETQQLRERLREMEEEREEGWRQAQAIAAEFDAYEGSVASGAAGGEASAAPSASADTSRRSSRVVIARKHSTRRAGLRSSIHRSARSSISSNRTSALFSPGAFRSGTEDVPPVPRLPGTLGAGGWPQSARRMSRMAIGEISGGEAEAAMTRAARELCEMLGIDSDALEPRGKPRPRSMSRGGVEADDDTPRRGRAGSV